MHHNRPKIIFYTGIFTYFTLACIAALYFKERTAFMDVAFRIFHILKDGDFAIQADRFGEALTQWIPVLGSHLKLSTKWIAWSYSVGVVGYYFCLFLLCYKVLQQPKFALLLLLFNVFMVSYTFWWMQIEFAQAIALSIVFFAWLTKEKTLYAFLNWKGILLLLLLHTLFYFHPLLPLVLVYFLIFFQLNEDSIDRQLTYTIIGLIGLEYVVKLVFIGNSSYDSVAIKGLDNFARLFPNYLNLAVNRNFLAYCWSDYYLLPIALLGSIAFYIFHRQKWKLILLLSSFFGYLLLVNVSNYKGIAQFHIESFYLPLSLFVLCPLIFDILPKIKSNKIFFAALVLILMVRTVHIYQLHTPYTARVEYYENLIEKSANWNHQKLIIPNADAPLDTLWQTWASSQEIWLLSAITSPKKPASLMFSHKSENFHWALPRNQYFFTEWEQFPYDTLPKQYFNFQDSSPYVILKEGELKDQ